MAAGRDPGGSPPYRPGVHLCYPVVVEFVLTIDLDFLPDNPLNGLQVGYLTLIAE